MAKKPSPGRSGRLKSQASRNKMSGKNFALPKGTGTNPSANQYPMKTRRLAANARARVMQHGTASEQKTVYRRTGAKYPGLKKTATYKRVTGGR